MGGGCAAAAAVVDLDQACKCVVLLFGEGDSGSMVGGDGQVGDPYGCGGGAGAGG